jgi:hypothetical protein
MNIQKRVKDFSPRLTAVDDYRLVEHKSKNVRILETAISQALASVVDLQWPSKRWPIHVFTAGAMICLATSTICHLFSSFGYKNAQVHCFLSLGEPRDKFWHA